ncbi:MAG: glycosyltransferase [Ectobacillus sp.]
MLKAQKVKVNWEGSYFVNHSLALVNREICKRLIAENRYDIGTIPYEEDPKFVVDDTLMGIKENQASPDSQAHITIRHQWPPNFNKPNSDKWVLFQPWEFGAIPRKWYIPMKYWIDEIWVYSNYNKECYIRSGIPENKVKVIPLGVDETVFHNQVKPLELKTEKSFHFLFVGGTIPRKGIDMLLQAYVDEFSANDDVCLVIKDFGTNSFYRGSTAGQMIEKIQKRPNSPKILYLNEDLSSEDLAGLYKACDCLVHPYRGEGFGLPIIESMACGTPVIVPALGPVADFCDEDTAFFIPSEEERWSAKKIGEMETVDYPWWLKVDKNELQKKMRFAYENQNLVKQKGQQASRNILSAFTWKQTAGIVSRRLEEMASEAKASPIDHQEIIRAELKIAGQLFHQQAVQKSFDILHSLLDVYPNSLPVRYHTALFYFRTKNFSHSLNHLLHITGIMQEQPEAFQSEIWNYIGICYMNMRQAKQALAAFQKGMKATPANIEMAIACYQQMIQDFHQYKGSLKMIDLYDGLGTLYFQMGNDFRAEEMYSKALALDSNRLDIQEKLKSVKNRILLMRETYINPSPDKGVKDVQELYHRVAHYFEGDEELIHQLYQKWVSYFLPGERVLDIGCGNGLFIELLNEKGVEAEGLDFDKEKVEQGREKGLSIYEQRAEAFLAEKEAVYDGIFLGHIIEHIPPRELLNLLIQCTKALKTNGKIIILTPNIAHPPVLENFWLDLTHVRPYPKALVEAMLQSLGFAVKESGYRNHDYDLFVIAQKNVYDLLWQSVVFNSTGYAEEQRFFLDSLKPFPVKVSIKPVDIQQKGKLTDTAMMDYLTNLQHNKLASPLIHYQAAPAYQFHAPRAPISIGRTMFETDRLPPGWIEKINELTEIWVPSAFNKETFAAAGVEEERIFVMPAGLDGKKYDPKRVTPYQLKDVKSFKFLSVFDWNKRKGWDVLVRAFMQEFDPKEDVCLILKVSKWLEQNTHPREEIMKLARSLGLISIPHIHIIETTFTEEEMIQLYKAADAFVLPSRGEGWGRPYMEAMAMALPTIGTRWGGQTAFMNDTNSYLIDVEGLLPIDRSIPYFGQLHGHKWAEPSEEHVRLLMREVYENTAKAKQIGNKARQDILAHFSKEKVAELMYKRIDELVKRHYG